MRDIYYVSSPCQVGMLWEVTDLDCDRVTIQILNCFLGTKYAVFGLPSTTVSDSSDQPDLLQGAVRSPTSIPFTHSLKINR